MDCQLADHSLLLPSLYSVVQVFCGQALGRMEWTLFPGLMGRLMAFHVCALSLWMSSRSSGRAQLCRSLVWDGAEALGCFAGP